VQRRVAEVGLRFHPATPQHPHPDRPLAGDLQQSWAEILRHLLDLRRPGDRVRVVNGGLSAHTTAMVLRRWPAALAQRPDWVVCLLGGEPVVDLVAAFGTPPDSDLLGPDGVHPTLARQAAIVTALVEHLTTSSPTAGDGP
jgi:lysophospholipase L1-like esterase